MQILKDLVSTIKSDAPVRKLLMGVHWTAVSSKFCGMASTVTGNQPHGEEAIRDVGKLDLKSGLQLTELAYSNNSLESCLGLAAINSLLPCPHGKISQKNAFEVLIEKAKNKKTAIFGHFPYLDRMKKTSKELFVFELNPQEDEIPFSRVPDLLPQAEIVAITSNTFINHTIVEILPYIKNDAFSIMVGPSTPMSSILFDYGFSMIAGVRILDEGQLYHTISQGAVFRQIAGVELITWEK